MNNTDFYVKVYPYLYDSWINDYRLSDEEPFVSKVYAINVSDSEFLVYDDEVGFYWVSFQITCKFKDGQRRPVVELSENPEG